MQGKMLTLDIRLGLEMGQGLRLGLVLCIVLKVRISLRKCLQNGCYLNGLCGD